MNDQRRPSILCTTEKIRSLPIPLQFQPTASQLTNAACGDLKLKLRFCIKRVLPHPSCCNSIFSFLQNRKTFRCTEAARHNNVVSYGTLIDLCCKVGVLEMGLKLFEDGVWPNLVVYTTLIDGCCKVDAMDVVGDLSRSGLLPDEQMLATVMDAQFKSGNVPAAVDVYKDLLA